MCDLDVAEWPSKNIWGKKKKKTEKQNGTGIFPY